LRRNRKRPPTRSAAAIAAARSPRANSRLAKTFVRAASCSSGAPSPAAVSDIGARVRRVEDPRLLTGLGTFTDDRIVAGALHVALRRSDHAHALIDRDGSLAIIGSLIGCHVRLPASRHPEAIPQ
jgi:hypothetical protein